jgi:hypothetical protein
MNRGPLTKNEQINEFWNALARGQITYESFRRRMAERNFTAADLFAARRAAHELPERLVNPGGYVGPVASFRYYEEWEERCQREFLLELESLARKRR